MGKLANNLIIGVGRLAIGEAFAMAKQAGRAAGPPLPHAAHLHRRQLDAALARRRDPASGEHPPATFLGLKDLTAAVESGRSVHQAMPVTSLARELYQLIDAKLGGLHGSNEVLRYYLEA